MNDLNFIRDEGNKLPPGFRFQPTDEEIVFQYLARKTFSHPLPAQVISEINIFSFDPWELPGNSEQDKYFFSYGNDSQTKRVTCSGYWKASGSTKRIVCSESMPIVGIRKTLVFHEEDNSGCGSFDTDWIMREYCVALSEDSGCNNIQHSRVSLVQIGNWRLYHVFVRKKRSGIREVDDDDENDDMGTASSSDTDSDSDSSSSGSSSSPHVFDSSVYTHAEVSSTSSNG